MAFFSAKKHETDGQAEPLSGHIDSRRSKIWLALTILLFTGLILVAGSLLWYQKNTSAKDPSGQVQLFSIREGDTPGEISQRLHDDGYIRSELAFKVALRLSGKAANIKAGQYRLSASEDVHSILNKLVSGEADVIILNILPGETLQEIRNSLVELGYTEAQVEAAVSRQYDHPVLADKPTAASLEGYLYPDSYEIDLAQGPEVVIEKSLDNFDQKLVAEGLSSASFRAADLNLHQAIILGSIIEKEVNAPEDRSIVAQVFLKRLEIDMQLGSDATFVYAAREMGVAPAVDLDSPYNTRIVNGLPPGPISNMTIDALAAVAKPANTDYLYFVTGDDNTTHYGRTAQEHDENVENYCGVRCEL